MERTLIAETVKQVGKTVLLKGWVNNRRDHGKLIFLDLRDRTGLIQVVITNLPEAKDLRQEWVVAIEGIVKQRPEKLVNPKIPTGQIELEAHKLDILAQSEELPFDVDSDGRQIDEETRLKYRYLDLRRPRMTNNLRMRHRVIKYMRDYLDRQGFVEIETPVLTKATPEGARDFIVPSRLQPGNFYALPQSPQQYKQLLMVAGYERYYQIARCFRDEDPRADRAYGEFTQLDMEFSFASREEILDVVEGLYRGIIADLYPNKQLTFKAFPRLGYDEVMKKYRVDKPDLRKDKNNPDELAFCFVVDFPLFEWKERENRWDATHHPFTAPKPEEVMDLMSGKNLGQLKSLQYDFVLNGFEIGGGSIRITDPKIQTKIFETLGHTQEAIQTKFGHLLSAFKYGVPPHGGIAPGIDRFLMIVQNEPNLREVIAYPMASSGITAVMEAPSTVDQAQLDELGISVGQQIKGDIFSRIIDLLLRNDIKYQKFEHEPVFTSEQAAKARGTDIRQGAKALLMYADDKPVMLIISAANKVDNAKFKKLFKVQNLRMATPEEVKQVTGTQIGAVPPFPGIFKIPGYVDKSLAENKEIAFNAGLHTKSLKLGYRDWLSVSGAVPSDFSAPDANN